MGRTNVLVVLLAVLLVGAWGCARGGVKTGGQAEGVVAERLGAATGCGLARFEYYGWHHFLRCGEGGGGAGPSGVLEAPPELLFSHEGCRGYAYEYYGPQLFVICGAPAGKMVGTKAANKLDRPAELVVRIEGCSVYRFEYYGWHYFARCDGAEPRDRPGKVTETPELVLARQGCRAHRFEYYGNHYLIRCGLQQQGPGQGQPLETIPLRGAGGCRAHRFEHYGWHTFTVCPKTPSAFTTALFSCGKNCVREETLQSVIY